MNPETFIILKIAVPVQRLLCIPFRGCMRLPGELCFAFGATLSGFVTAVVNLSHRYAKDSAFLCRDFCFAVINRSDRDELRTTIV